jgi:hypothetical protein
MGTGHSLDTAIRIGHFGISSVISLVDDLLVERVRKHYCEKHGFPYERIKGKGAEGRPERTTAYLNMVSRIVDENLAKLKSLPFFDENDKKKYFDLLPDSSSLKKKYSELINKGHECSERSQIEDELNKEIKAGSIDVNIMVKLDKINYDKNKEALSSEFTDAKLALKGYAESCLKSSIIFSAGINQTLFGYMSNFKDFYRDEVGDIKKKIILKVSDFRSALIQGKFLAKKGLEVYEFRIESGLNCGGHAFPSNGLLLASLLKEFKEKRSQLKEQFAPIVQKYYESKGWKYTTRENEEVLLTVQGGIGNNGERLRLMNEYGVDATGWATPFLLVPEATGIDAPTREQCRLAGEDDLYLSPASPLSIPFNNLRGSGSELKTKELADEGNPGSACPKGFLVSNTEFSELPICLASKEYQTQKLVTLENDEVGTYEKSEVLTNILAKACICDHLGNGLLIELGVTKNKFAPQSICPGPNLAWFNKYYTLNEMVDHIYGRSPSLVPPERPHMFAKEIGMYVEYLEQQLKIRGRTPKDMKFFNEFKANLYSSIDYLKEISAMDKYEDENLTSINPIIDVQMKRVETILLNL